MMDTSTIDYHRCPRCEGGHETPCALCGDRGIIDDETLASVEAGRKIRAERLACGLGVRKFAAQCRLTPVQLMLIEQGLSPVPNHSDFPNSCRANHPGMPDGSSEETDRG